MRNRDKQTRLVLVKLYLTSWKVIKRRWKCSINYNEPCTFDTREIITIELIERAFFKVLADVL